MGDGLIERLLDVWQNTTNDEHADIIHEAADRIDQLEAQLGKLARFISDQDEFWDNVDDPYIQGLISGWRAVDGES